MSTNQQSEGVNGQPAVGDVIDLRDYRVSTFPNDLEHSIDPTPFLRYQELRARRIREYGWCDLDDAGRDRDHYDDLESQTTTAVLHREDSSILAGVRYTRFHGELAAALSVQMWDPASQRTIAAHPYLREQFELDRVVDMTRLFLDDSGTIEHALVTIGACFQSSSRRLGAFCTLNRTVDRLLQLAGLPSIEIHRGELGGVQALFVVFSVETLSRAFDGKAGAPLRAGAGLLDMATVVPPE